MTAGPPVTGRRAALGATVVAVGLGLGCLPIAGPVLAQSLSVIGGGANTPIEIFAEDGIWEGAGFGKSQGHAAIRELFKKFQTLISFSQHQVMNPIIKIDGDRATGIWYFFGPFTFYKNNQAKWLAARYDDDYVKVNGEWKIQHLRARGRMTTDYEKSWADKE